MLPVLLDFPADDVPVHPVVEFGFSMARAPGVVLI